MNIKTQSLCREILKFPCLGGVVHQYEVDVQK